MEITFCSFIYICNASWLMDRLDGKGNAKEKWDIISQATEWKRFGVIFILGGIENVNNKNLENQ